MWTSCPGRFGRSRSDLPDQVLAVAAARLVPADLLVALPQLACGHRPEPPALGRHVESFAGRPHRASSGCSLPRAGHSDAQVGHEIKACRARFREDSLAAESSQAADAAGEEVAEGAQVPAVGVGLVVVRQSRAEARCLDPCVSAKRGSSESGQVAGQNAHWEAGNPVCSAWRGLATSSAGFMMGGGGISRLYLWSVMRSASGSCRRPPHLKLAA